MRYRGVFFVVFLMGLCINDAVAQRVYAGNSVLATGSWYKIGVKQEGIYKVDVSFLSSLGINTSGLSSASIRLYGNGGGMLPENNAIPRVDDLMENPIEVSDGGDGMFNNADYFMFYAPGPDRWVKDSLNGRFSHVKNLYSDTAWYYITIGGQGKRITTQSPILSAQAIPVTSYNDRYFYENNLVNLLNSGKEWYGEEFDNNPGGITSRSFPVDWTGLVLSEPVTLVSDLAARSVGATAGFIVKLNGQQVQTITLPSVSGNFLDPFGTAVVQQASSLVSQASLSVNYTFNPTVQGAQAWLNAFELHGRRSLAVSTAAPLFFRDWRSVAPGSIAGFNISGAQAATEVWEITDPLQPVKWNATINGTQLSFNNDASRLREYVAFVNTQALSPIAAGKINNQNLHNSSPVKLLIVTSSGLLSEAQRLAAYHLQHDQYASAVVTTDQVYQEFSGGVADPSAIRDFVKMYYDNARGDTAQQPKYLLLFGSGSYDYKYRIAGNINMVPVYESVNSLDPLTSYTSDDFFGLLNDGDDINQAGNTALLDIGIGRIPARNIMEAKTMVDKIIRYQSPSGFGDWRNQSVYLADDQDYNLHLNDAETISADATLADPSLNLYKIYLDAYPLVSSSAGARYPGVNDAIVSRIYNGTFLFNYSGHGSYQRLAEEAVLTQDELNRFNNADKLPLFITASCDFAPHDDPVKNSLGAGLLTGGVNGAIALLTTTRLVFAYSNRVMNDNYLKTALTPAANGQYLSLGESVRVAKNQTILASGDLLNNQKFTLLGDPALRLSFPTLQIGLNQLNGHSLSGSDTLNALGKYNFSGVVTNANGSQANSFNGTLQITVYNTAQQVKTLGNDPTSPVVSFNQQSGILYKGTATVINDSFSFSFIMPKDISYKAGVGKISLYASNGVTDATGVNTSFFIGGNAAATRDTTGPVIQPYLNDDQFKNGGLTNENPVLLVKLFDSSGINTSGNGIGHDITAIIDGNEKNILVLNDYYTASTDSYQQGQVLFQLPTQTEGKHTISIKAWDVANNSSVAKLDYEVRLQKQLEITHVRNFPNPFTGSTTFAFEHNQPGTNLDVTILIYDAAGRMVKQISQVLNTPGTRNCQIIWNGDTQSGAKLTKGVYIYHVIVAAGSNKTENTQQLIRF